MLARNRLVINIAKFFLKKIWPEVQKALAAFFIELVDWLLTRIRHFIQNFNTDKVKHAVNKAKEFKKKAEKATCIYRFVRATVPVNGEPLVRNN